MAGTQGIRAGRAFVELFADDRKLVRGLRRAEKRLKAFGNSVRNLGLKLAGLGTAMFAPLAASAKLFSGYGDQVAKMAKRTGLSVETLSELRFVASQTGTEFESLEMGFRKMQRSIYDAGRGLSTQVDALNDLGLTYRDLDGLSGGPEDQFKLLADRIGRIEDPTRKAAIAMTLFGRTGTNLLPMFAAGSAGIHALQEEARRLGLTLSGEDAKAAEDFTDALDRLWKVVKMAAFNIGAALAPTLQAMATWLLRVAVSISEWVKQNRGAVVTALAVAAVVTTVGVALVTLGATIVALGSVVGGLVTVITVAVAVVKALIAAVAFLVTPVGLVIVAVAALGGVLLWATGAGAKALAWLGDRFDALKDTALASYQGIADALAAGDIKLAMRILWLSLKMQWTRGVNFLEKAWLNFRNFFIKIGHDAFTGLLAVAEIVWHALEVGWIETTAFFSRLWTGFTGFFARTWENIKAGAKRAWNWIKSLFDDSIDLRANNRLIEQQRQAAIARIDDDRRRQLAEQQARRQHADDLHETTMAVIGQANLDVHDALDAGYADRMAENERDLLEARRAWREAIAAARGKRDAADAARNTDPSASPAPLEPAFEFDPGAIPGLSDIGQAIKDQAEKIGVTGTFNVTAAFGLGAGSSIEQRTAKASEETARNTRHILDAVRTGAMEFV